MTAAMRRVAEAYAEKLYRSDLLQIIPPDASRATVPRSHSGSSTTGCARGLAAQGRGEPPAAQKDVERQLDEYRESLITYAYEQALVETEAGHQHQ